MYYISNRGLLIKLEDISAIVPIGNMGLCEVHLKGGSVVNMNDHNGLLQAIKQESQNETY